MVAWSSGFVGATLGTQFAGASTLLAWRFFFAAAVMLGWVLLMRRGWPSVHEFGVQVVLGLLSQVVYLGCIVGSAEIGVSGGIAALIAALLSNLMLEATAGAGWGTLVFGLTELQSGVLAALAWISFGYSL
ncbi:MAG: EamA family transporter, partial [Rubrobacter sp.]